MNPKATGLKVRSTGSDSCDLRRADSVILASHTVT
jgi:hypothetical protein